MRYSLVSFFTVSLLLTGCEAPQRFKLPQIFEAPQIFSPTGSEGQWEKYETFNFVPSGGSDGRVVSTLHAEVSRQLNARGMKRSRNPDVLVNIAVHTRQRSKARAGTAGFAAARYPFLQDYYRDLSKKHVTDIDGETEGRLTIDVLDVKQGEMVWRGRTGGRITPAMMQEPEETLATAVDEIFREFPKAGG
ncbi:DUF4136 domain-containing protein [Microbulbifer yueqingensis]|uniref:DUF4136 domain-containing protein n=1 Tax=Microbulbifer yueqingensis TaxID=658219 RepID=A0A1G8ULQ8_9GAMM|nr:DUF4136 domain-containing protein [Microbulbifer yueqingensis]SDJ54574.1 protein of unknown function [Microbulbifer yueqingensis]